LVRNSILLGLIREVRPGSAFLFRRASCNIRVDVVSDNERLFVYTGIARSTPRTSIFATEAERAFFGNAYLSQMVNGTGEGVAKAWGIGHVIGKLAKAHDEEEGDYLQYINTPNTARDMMRILESYGEEKL